MLVCFFFFFSSRRRHTRLVSDWSSDVCSSDLVEASALSAALARLSPSELVLHEGLLADDVIGEAVQNAGTPLTPLRASAFDSDSARRRLEALLDRKSVV